MIEDAVVARALRARERIDARLDHRGGVDFHRPLARAAHQQRGELLAIAHEVTGGAFLRAARRAFGTFLAHP